MRRLPGLLFLFLAFPAAAETLDCALIKSTTNPFELTLDSTSTKEGKEPVTISGAPTGQSEGRRNDRH